MQLQICPSSEVSRRRRFARERDKQHSGDGSIISSEEAGSYRHFPCATNYSLQRMQRTEPIKIIQV